jgi:hypothetical protein
VQRKVAYIRAEAELRLEYMTEYVACTQAINEEEVESVANFAITTEYGDSLITLDDIVNRHNQLVIGYGFWDKGEEVTYQWLRDEIFDLTNFKFLSENYKGEWEEGSTVKGVDRELVFSAFGFGMGQVEYIRTYEDNEKLQESMSLAKERISKNREIHIEDKIELKKFLEKTDAELAETEIIGLTLKDFEE